MTRLKNKTYPLRRRHGYNSLTIGRSHPTLFAPSSNHLLDKPVSLYRSVERSSPHRVLRPMQLLRLYSRGRSQADATLLVTSNNQSQPENIVCGRIQRCSTEIYSAAIGVRAHSEGPEAQWSRGPQCVLDPITRSTMISAKVRGRCVQGDRQGQPPRHPRAGLQVAVGGEEKKEGRSGREMFKDRCEALCRDFR